MIQSWNWNAQATAMRRGEKRQHGWKRRAREVYCWLRGGADFGLDKGEQVDVNFESALSRHRGGVGLTLRGLFEAARAAVQIQRACSVEHRGLERARFLGRNERRTMRS